MTVKNTYTAFAGYDQIAKGELIGVTTVVKDWADAREPQSLLVFCDQTGQQMDLDLRGSLDQVLAWARGVDPQKPVAPDPIKRSPGRPKLGVVGREVTLLPRHWDWLNSQPGGASVALRKLVDKARNENADLDRIRKAREGAYQFMSALAGNQPGFEEASRALFAGKQNAFEQHTRGWPKDVLHFLNNLTSEAWTQGETT